MPIYNAGMFKFRLLKTLASILIAFCCNHKACAHTVYGVISLSGRTILPLKYKNIQQHGSMVLFVTKFKADIQDGLPSGLISVAEGTAEPISVDSSPLKPTNPHIVFEKGQVALADENGKLLCEPIYSNISPIGEERFVGYKPLPSGPKFFMLGKRGEEIAELHKTGFEPMKFSEGLLRVGGTSNPVSFVDTDGAVVIPETKFFVAGDFSEGLASVQVRDGRKASYGYIDRAGQMVVGPFDSAQLGDFKDGHAMITFYDYANGRLRIEQKGVIDRSGAWLIKPEYVGLWRWDSKHYLAVKNNRLFILDLNEKAVCEFPANCTRIEDFVPLEEGQLIPCEFGDAITGNLVFGGTACNDGKWGYCDIFGKVVIPPNFQQTRSFQNDYAEAVLLPPKNPSSDKWPWLCGLINKRGEWFLEPKYSSIEMIGKDLAIVSVTKDVFNSEDWADSRDRTKLFSELLSEYNLIGQTEAWLIEMLGKPYSGLTDQLPTTVACKKLISYSLKSSRHFPLPFSQLDFALDEQDQIRAWRIGESSEWITQNVQINNWPSAQDPSLITSPK